MHIRLTYIILLCQGPNEGDNLETSCGVETTGWLIQEQDLWRRNQLACYTDTALLPTADPLADWRSYDRIFLFPETEGINQSVDSHDTVLLCETKEDPKLVCPIE